MTHAFAPTVGAPRGLQPHDFEPFVCTNKTTTTMSIGASGVFDLIQASATSMQPGGTASIWSVIRAHSNTNGYLTWAIPVVYVGKPNGAQTDLLTDEVGLFKVAGLVRAIVNNIGGASAPKGSPVCAQTASTVLETSDDATDLRRNAKIVGFTSAAIDAAATVTQLIYFNGWGLGSALSADAVV